MVAGLAMRMDLASNQPFRRQEQERPPRPACWRPGLSLSAAPAAAFPVIRADQVKALVPGLDLWDCWPLVDEAGAVAPVLIGSERQHLWFFLSAPRFDAPDLRHDCARIRLLAHGVRGWSDLGPALPEGWSPGSREWAGSAVLGSDGTSVTLYMTAAGRRGESEMSFEQRLYAIRGRLSHTGIGLWQEPVEVVSADGIHYLSTARQPRARPGLLKAFRDPFWFRDPATGREHILFTGNAASSAEACNGVIGLATRTRERWVLNPPLVDAVGVNNELERPQLHLRDGGYYLFWSTQAHTFSPEVPHAPTGLYGMVAERLSGPWRPLNRTGLVAANPAGEPAQGYSWCITGDGRAWSFVDYWGMKGRDLASSPQLVRQQFGGTLAPVAQLVFHGDRVLLAPAAPPPGS